MAVCGEWICFNSDWTTFFNQSSRQWVNLLAGPDTQLTFSSQRFTCCSADDAGFWLGNGDNRIGWVRFVDPKAPLNVRLIKLPGLPVAMAHHGPWLWVVLDYPGALSRLVLIDKRTDTLVAQIVLPGQRMEHLAAADDRIWVGGDKSTERSGLWEDGSALLEVDLQEPRSDEAASKSQQPLTYPLLRAVSNGDVTALDALLAKRENPDEASASGWTSLMTAAASGRIDLATRLLAAGANPNLLSKEGDSALQQAALRGDVASAKLLLQHGANPNLHSLVKLRGMGLNRHPISSIFDSAPPSQPTGLKATVTGDGEVELSWEDRSNNEMQFEIFFHNGYGSNMLVDRVAANVTRWVDPAARDETELVYEVRAINHASSPLSDGPIVKIRRPQVSSRIIRLPYGLNPGGTQLLPPEVVSQSPLATAAGGGFSQLVALLLASGADPNIEDAAGSTPVINAARHRQYGTVRQLVAAKANPVFSAETGDTAVSLVYQWHEDEALLKELLGAVPEASRLAETSALLVDAAERGQVRDVETFLSLGGDIVAEDEFGQSALSRAFDLKQREAALTLLKSQRARLKKFWQPPQSRESDERILTAIIGANDPEALTILLEDGLDVNRKTGGKPIVVVAAEKKAFLGLEFLLAHGADALAKDEKGNAAKDYLTPEQAQRHLVAMEAPTVKQSWPPPNGRTLMRPGPTQFVLTPDPARATASEALIAACKADDLSAAQRAEAAGAELEYYNAEGKTPLITAIAARALKVAHWLVEEGALVNRPTPKGYSPLAFAVEAEHPEFIDYLIQAGADVNLRGDFAASPLLLAAQKENVALLRQLLEAGADPNLSMYVNGLDLSPLAVALDHGNTAAVDLLLAHKANLKAEVYFFTEKNNVQVKSSQASLLMHAASGRNITLIKRMISLGQDPAFKNGQGYDALSWAAGVGSREAVEFLLPLSARKGNALENAQGEGHMDIVEILQRANYESSGPRSGL